MSFAVGSSVAASGFGLGYVTGHLGAPDGGASHVVRAPNTPDSLKGGTFRTGELQPGPAMPVFEVGQEVRLFGRVGEVLARAGDSYTVQIFIERSSGLVFNHVYPAVPAWKLALGWG